MCVKEDASCPAWSKQGRIPGLLRTGFSRLGAALLELAPQVNVRAIHEGQRHFLGLKSQMQRRAAAIVPPLEVEFAAIARKVEPRQALALLHHVSTHARNIVRIGIYKLWTAANVHNVHGVLIFAANAGARSTDYTVEEVVGVSKAGRHFFN